MNTYHLRPHHGLCLEYFCGQGYSQDFINNMQKIIDTLDLNPNIQLVSHMDDICLTCPNCINEINKKYCTFNKKVLHYDNCVMELCNLTYDSFLPWDEFHKLIHNNILNKNLRQTICGDCEWSHLCHK